MIKVNCTLLVGWALVAVATVLVGPSSVVPNRKMHDHGLPGLSHSGTIHNGGKPGLPISAEWGALADFKSGTNAPGDAHNGFTADAVASTVLLKIDLEASALIVRMRKIDAEGTAIAQDSREFGQVVSGEAIDLDVRGLIPSGALGESLVLDVEAHDSYGNLHSRSLELRPSDYSHPALNLVARADFSESVGTAAENQVKGDEKTLKSLAKRAAASVIEFGSPIAQRPSQVADPALSRISKDSDGSLVESFPAVQDRQ